MTLKKLIIIVGSAMLLTTTPMRAQVSTEGVVPEPTGCLVADIIILADMSSSVQGAEHFIWDAVAVLPTRFEMLESKVRMGLIRFAGMPEVVIPLTGDRNFFLKNLGVQKTYGASGSSTNIYGALEEAKKQFDRSPRNGIPRFIVLVTDGLSGGGWLAENQYAQSLQNEYITILGIHTPVLLPQAYDEDADPERSMEHNDSGDYAIKKAQAERERIEAQKTWEKGGRHLKELSTESLYFETEYETLEQLFRELTICT